MLFICTEFNRRMHSQRKDLVANMGIISDIKCAVCDRKYSGVRSRCPYCGARRIGRGKYSEDSDNSRGKMLISVLIMAVFTVAAGVLLFTTPVEAESTPSGNDPGIVVPGDDDTHGQDGIHPVPPPTEPPTEPPTTLPPLEVTGITITYDGTPKVEFMARIGEVVPLRIRLEPVGIDAEIIWSSSNTEVFDVVPVDINGSGATVTGIGRGTATLTVAAGGIEQTCTVYVQ